MAKVANLSSPAVDQHNERQAPVTHRKYLYAILAEAQGQTYPFLGIEGGVVYSVSDGRVAAVVSDVPHARIRPERRHLAAHHEVLKRLMEQMTPLPMSFGIVADDPQAIHRILSSNREAFLSQLDRVSGKVEMGLRVTWDVPNIFEYFVEIHPELRSARDRLLGAPRQATQQDRIEVGRLFDRILTEDRETHTSRAESVLNRRCFEMKRNPCRNEKEVMNLACLVGREGQSTFEEGIFQTARQFDNSFAFDYNGPWAPHNFVEMNLQL